MTELFCRDCKSAIAAATSSCPKCGADDPASQASKRSAPWWPLVLVSTVVVAVSVFMSSGQELKPEQQAKAPAPDNAKSIEAALATCKIPLRNGEMAGRDCDLKLLCESHASLQAEISNVVKKAVANGRPIQSARNGMHKYRVALRKVTRQLDQYEAVDVQGVCNGLYAMLTADQIQVRRQQFRTQNAASK